MTLRIHAFPASPRAFKALAEARHLGVDHEMRMLDLTKGEQKQAAFTAINPNQKMPALEHCDFKLWESNAIAVYLADLKPESGLMPADKKARALVSQWLFWESTTWDPPCATLLFERFVKGFFGGGGPDTAIVEQAEAKLTAAAEILNAHVRGKRFVCGDALCVADFALGSALTAQELLQFPFERYAEIARWHASLEQLPAWREVRALQQPPEAA